MSLSVSGGSREQSSCLCLSQRLRDIDVSESHQGLETVMMLTRPTFETDRDMMTAVCLTMGLT